MIDGQRGSGEGDIYRPRTDLTEQLREVPEVDISATDIGSAVGEAAVGHEIVPTDVPTVVGEIMNEGGDGNERNENRRPNDTPYHHKLVARPYTAILGGGAVEVDFAASDAVTARAKKMETEGRTGTMVAVHFSPQPRSGMVTWARPDEYKLSNTQVNSDNDSILDILNGDDLVEVLSTAATAAGREQHGDVAKATFGAIVSAFTDPETGKLPTLREIRDGIRFLDDAKPEETYGQLPALGYGHSSYVRRNRLTESIPPEKQKDNKAIYAKLAVYMNTLAPDTLDRPIEPSRFQDSVAPRDIDPNDITLLHAGMASGSGSGFKARLSVLVRSLLPIVDGQTHIGRPAALELVDFDRAFEADPEGAMEILTLCEKNLIPVVVHAWKLDDKTLELVKKRGTRVLLPMDAVEAAHVSRILGTRRGTLPSGRTTSVNANFGTNDGWSENEGFRATLPGITDNTGTADSGGLTGGLAWSDSENLAFSMQTPNFFDSELLQIEPGQTVIVTDPAEGGERYNLRTLESLGHFPPARPEAELSVGREITAIAGHVQNSMQRHAGQVGTTGSLPALPSAEAAALRSGQPAIEQPRRKLMNPLRDMSADERRRLTERFYVDATGKRPGSGDRWATHAARWRLYEAECDAGLTDKQYQDWITAKQQEAQRRRTTGQ